MKYIGIAAVILFVATVYAANWVFTKYGTVPVGFGLEAPAAVYFVGLAFTLRDVVHRTLGRWVVIPCIVLGAGLSYWLGANTEIPGGMVSIAVASGLAFLVSELCDLAVYEPIRKRGWLPAVTASNVAGLFVDSALFLWLAGGTAFLSMFFAGQVVGKAWMTLAALALLGAAYAVQRRRGEALPV